MTPGILCLLVIAAAALAACSDDRGGRPFNLLLITVDTTRADRFGCYGYDKPTTTCIDRLAARGILFEHAVSPVPITLPSHATILTGLDPHEHGVRNNNTFALDDAHTTIAERLKESGFVTGATLGAFPVDGRFGLSQGFDSYDDRFDPHTQRAALRMTQRPADRVTRKALDWIGANRENPFFHWAHYFDPHFPYEPPAEFATKFDDPYDGEIAAMDAAIGRLVDGLGDLGLLENTWIVLVGDHGESLGEHGETFHAMLIHGATQKVPCIVVPPTRWNGLADDACRGRRVSQLVRTRDLFPTMLAALGVPAALGIAEPETGDDTGSRNLLAVISGEAQAPPAAYMESLAPSLEYGWCALRGVRTGKWVYIRAPEPELYDLEADPAESRNVITDHPRVAEGMSSLCDAFLEREVDLDQRATDAETMAKLRALGYTAASFRAGPLVNDKDPKKLVHLMDEINEAMTFMGASRPDDARKLLEQVLVADPHNPLANRLLGSCLVALGRFADAVTVMSEHLERYPEDTEVLVGKAQALALDKKLSAAQTLIEELLSRDPGHREAADLYPRILVEAGREAEARAFLDKATRERPDDANARARFGFFELYNGTEQEAAKLCGEALAIDPRNSGANAVLGEIKYLEGHRLRSTGAAAAASRPFAASRAYMEKALESDSLEFLAAFRMGCFLHEEGDTRGAREFLQIALFRMPNWPEAHARMAAVLWSLDEYGPALLHYGMADLLGFHVPGFLFNYGVALARTGHPEEAVAIWKKALAQNPPAPLARQIENAIQQTESRK